MWLNLKTTNKSLAVAMVAWNNYATQQNGNTEMTVSPEPFLPAAFRLSEFLALNFERPGSLPPMSPVTAAEKIATQNKAPERTLTHLVERFRHESRHLAPATREKFDFHFKVAARYLGFDEDIGAITLADLRQLKSNLSDGRKPSTVNDIIFKALAALFRMALEDGLIERSPLENLKRAKRSEPDRAQPTWQQAQQIETEVGRHAPETKIIVGLMRSFGVGQAEIRFLHGEDVDEERSIIHFRRKKTGKSFDVPIFPYARPLVAKLKAEGRLQIGKPVVEWRNPRKCLASACERLGLPRFEPRALRRAFIIYCLQQGIDPRLVAKWQGHKDAKLIFSVYGKFIDLDYERTQAERLGSETIIANQQSHD